MSGNTAYLTLQLVSPEDSGLSFSTNIHTWYETQWQDVVEVQACAISSAPLDAGHTGIVATQTNAEYYVGFVPALTIAVV